VLDLDHEALDAPGDASGPASFINVVFQQRDDASLTLTILDKLGTSVALDFGARPRRRPRCTATSTTRCRSVGDAICVRWVMSQFEFWRRSSFNTVVRARRRVGRKGRT
jgi:hypothetical protein